MGITGKIAMPFLSTLAALVIIVHSTEEDTESDFRRDLRPRVLDTGSPTYDQPWRVVDQESMIQKPTQNEAWNDNSQEEPPKRRRFGRKRKRRPQSSLNEGHVPQDRYGYPEEPPRPYFDVEVPNERHTTDTVKRRRKKLDGRPRWTEEPLEQDRPFKRRGQRRKRPSLEAWPELSEFNEYKMSDSPQEGVTERQVTKDDIQGEPQDAQNEGFSSSTANDNDESTEQTPLEEEFDDPLSDKTTGFTLPSHQNDFESLLNKPELQEDKSLSEFSIEVMTHAHELRIDEPTQLQSKMGDKAVGVLDEHDKSLDKFLLREFDHNCISDFITPIKPHPDMDVNYEALKFNTFREKAYEKIEQSSTIKKPDYNGRSNVLNKCRDKLQTRSANNGPIDPVTLKDLLKKSNGSSLSEILQQHNLSLADLLRGKENAISILKSENKFEYRRKSVPDILADSDRDVKDSNNNEALVSHEDEEDTIFKEKQPSYSINKQSLDLISENTNSELASLHHDNKDLKNKSEDSQIITTTGRPETVTQKSARIRFPTGLRKKLRMRPMMNTTYKAQLSRDLIALNARKYIHHRRNNTKLKEWKNILPSFANKSVDQTENTHKFDLPELNHTLEDTTTAENVPLYNISALSNNDIQVTQFEDENLNVEVTTQTYTTTKVIVMEIFPNITAEKPKRPRLKGMGELLGNRRQPYNNRKKKRVRQKTSTTEAPGENVIKAVFGINDFEPSDIISRPYKSQITEEIDVFPTNLEDFMTTRPSNIRENEKRPSSTTTMFPATQSSTEESAKIEIDEILNDNGASARLSKILVERNMTLSELVEHRERGSSHVHLADIFHNASKEPNPPEPFLSKSLIEPISKETYPLRAILEANLHDANLKVTTVDPSMVENNYIHIPVVMNFGSNVNENAENMGIMSLFSNFTRLNTIDNKKVNTDNSIVQPVKAEIKPETTTQPNDSSTNLRESRVLSDISGRDSQDDVASWNEIFSLMRKTYKNETKDLLETYQEDIPSGGMKKITLEEEIDGDGLVVLEDLQHLKDFENNIAPVSDEKLDFDSMERSGGSSGILEPLPSQTKSVTVATASIAGLAMVLFLLTYAAFKWKQQRGTSGHKQNFSEERLPAPVFESRKGHKNNSSNRSISPMLSTSNIYTLNTLDSRNGKESPEYMWDTLRKPFQ